MRRLTTSVQKKFISHDGLKINYDVDYGEQKEKFLIFVHGLAGELSAFDADRIILKEFGYSTIALDQRGHGLSDRPRSEDDYSFENFVLDIKDLIKQETIKDFVLVGHCFGGMIVSLFAAKFPDLPRGLVLISTSYRPPWFLRPLVGHKIVQRFLAFFARHSSSWHIHKPIDYSQINYVADFEVKGAFLNLLRTSFRSSLFLTEKILSFNCLKTLKNITVPTLIINGTADQIFPPNLARQIHRRVKNSELYFIEGGKHLTVVNNSAEVAAAIHRFLKEIKF